MADPLAMVRAMLRDAEIARLATVTPSGRATAAPYWFAFDRKRIYIETVENATVANIRREPRVSLLVDFGAAYADLRGATVHGVAEAFAPDDAPDDVLQGIAAYTRKYAALEDARLSAGDQHRTRTLPDAYVVITPMRARWFTVGGHIQGAVDFSPRPR